MLQAEVRFVGWTVVAFVVFGAVVAAGVACTTTGHLSVKAALGLTVVVLLAIGYVAFALWLRAYEKSLDLPQSQRRGARYAPTIICAVFVCYQITALVITSPLAGNRRLHGSNESSIILWISLAITATNTLLVWRNQRRVSASSRASCSDLSYPLR